VHALLSHLARAGFRGSLRPLGIDGQSREILTFLAGETVGDTLPWPAWVHAEETLVEVAHWLREYHTTVAGFVPPAGAMWRMGGRWRPGLIIGHNDAAPYNAVWQADRLAGFIDWDMAGPVPPEWDLAYTAFSWVPLHARHVVEREGFSAFGARPDRLRLLLAEYGWREPVSAFLGVVAERITAHMAGIRSLAEAGDPLFARIVQRGAIQDMETALAELAKIG
jgi:Phosphotransferase enzyme family